MRVHQIARKTTNEAKIRSGISNAIANFTPQTKMQRGSFLQREGTQLIVQSKYLKTFLASEAGCSGVSKGVIPS